MMRRCKAPLQIKIPNKTTCWHSGRHRRPRARRSTGADAQSGEHSAFEELARELNARLKAAAGITAPPDGADDFGGEVVHSQPPVEAAEAGTRAADAPTARLSSTACRSAFWSIG